MIRINLIREEHKKLKKPAVLTVAPSDMTKQLVFLALFVITVAVCAFFWLDISGKKSALESDEAIALRERDRLKSVKELVDRLEGERSRLLQRLEVLSDLKNNLRNPMHAIFMVYLAQQENQQVTLSEVRETAGEVKQLRITGEASQENLNRFSDTLMNEPLVSSIDIISQVGERFEIVVRFQPIKGFGMGDAASQEGGEGTVTNTTGAMR